MKTHMLAERRGGPIRLADEVHDSCDISDGLWRVAPRSAMKPSNDGDGRLLRTVVCPAIGLRLPLEPSFGGRSPPLIEPGHSL